MIVLLSNAKNLLLPGLVCDSKRDPSNPAPRLPNTA